MKRQIITIDKAKCNGCGQCVSACAEGALKLVNGKARLVKELLCDGFGDCLGKCPTGALKIEMREAEAFDLELSKKHVAKERGEAGLKRLDQAAKAHASGGCPGTRMPFAAGESRSQPVVSDADAPTQAIRSDLQQWPVQIHLVSPEAHFFKNRELVVLSTCSPVASADIHWRFIRGRAVTIGCPKLDRTEGYAEKLGAILSDPSIPKVTVVRMQVPCCGGLSQIVREAIGISGRKDLVAREVVVALDGTIQSGRRL